MYAIKELDVIELQSDETEIVINNFKANGYQIVKSVPIEITTKLAEIKADLPKIRLREQRNALLSQTDWQASSDLTMTSEQTAYRQALRDLPSTATPALDEDGELTGVT